jgi:hypothetical protein
MNTDLRIPVTLDQKRMILEAISDDPNGMAAWARGVLMRAAEERITTKRRNRPKT